MELKKLKETLISQLEELNKTEWEACNIVFQFPPTINKGYKALPGFFDKENNRVRLFVPTNESFDEMLYKYIYDLNQEGKFNQITFSASRDKFREAKISVIFSQEIVDTFENNLPKSKRGKTIPW
jgi:hypothetical protein